MITLIKHTDKADAVLGPRAVRLTLARARPAQRVPAVTFVRRRGAH